MKRRRRESELERLRHELRRERATVLTLRTHLELLSREALATQRYIKTRFGETEARS